ncbi:MAG: folate-binding protein YgfZ [Acidobacteria bacterium]|jgi:folate-binding protein YgfZ|nr:folate-binding protein YgfZ [Acidobacteriota bacterium]
MNAPLLNEYKTFREKKIGFYEQKRGLIAVSGKESVQFLNGLITNDISKLEDGAVPMLAAFPNAQGRLVALVRVVRRSGEFLFETEAATRAKVFQNLFHFTFAGDFFVRDLSDDYKYFEVQTQNSKVQSPHAMVFQTQNGADYFVPKEAAEDFKNKLKENGAVEISEALYEVLRVENGAPKYKVDADETTIVPELGIDDLISYNKGCYIGQEIIARIHFRGHVAKVLTGLIFEAENAVVNPNDEIKSPDGKNAGRITSVAFSPTLEKTIALAYVRYEFLKAGTQLKVNDSAATVKDLPFV